MSSVNIHGNLRQRHRLIRAGFVAQGTSLKAWCEQQGVKRQNADKALVGQWTGAKATQLIERILVTSGVDA